MNDKLYKHSVFDNTQRAIKTGTPNIYTVVANEVADEMAIPKNPTTKGHNDSRDAFRHAYISALTTYRYGETAAKALGDINEAKNNLPWKNGNPPLEEWMDQENNRIGREIALKVLENSDPEQDLKSATKQALENGTLIETPYDPRRTYHEHGDWAKAIKEAEERMTQDKEKRLKVLDAGGQLDKQKRDEVEKLYKTHQEKIVQISTKLKPQSSEPSEIRTGPQHDSASTTAAASSHAHTGPTNANGDVFVHPYARRTGEVRSHTRRRPDGNSSNNLR